MESNRPSAPRGSREPARNYIQTNNLTVRDGTQRFSWQDTPLDLRRPIVQQSSPTNSSIDETPLDGHQTLPSIAPVPPQSHYPAEKLPLTHTDSPYNVPGISQTHPAYFAPVVEQDKPLQSNLTQPAPIPITAPEKAREKDKSPLPAFASSATSGHHDSSQSTKPESDRSTLVYNPHSLAGPNAAVENHRPGQVAHPNAAIDPEWKHGLCEVDTLCCVGLCCPCIVYGKTQYRISRKTQKEDPTNLLGYQSCNGSCGLMALACGFQWLLASIQRTRIRKLYQMDGNFGSDCLRSICCCCCVIMQDEREVCDREELIRRYAGPASAAYTTRPAMTYAPPPR